MTGNRPGQLRVAQLCQRPDFAYGPISPDTGVAPSLAKIRELTHGSDRAGASHLGPTPVRPRHLGPHGSALSGGPAPPSKDSCLRLRITKLELLISITSLAI